MSPARGALVVDGRPMRSRRAADAPVTLDVVVTDAQSRPIHDLRPADFELIDSGESRAVEARPAAVGRRPRARASFSMSFTCRPARARSRARAALTAFVDTQLRDGDASPS